MYNVYISKYYTSDLRYMKNISVTIENTSFCGANCQMCPRSKYKYKPMNMPEELFRSIVKQSYDIGVRQLDIGGYGDPLVDPNFSDRVKWIKSIYPNIRISTISTCQLLRGELADAVAEYVDDLKISHYGYSKDTYEKVHRGSLVFEDIKKNIEDFLERTKKPKITISYLILEDSKHEIEKWKEYWINKVDDMQIWYPHNYAGAKEEYDNITEHAWERVHSCGRPGRDFTFCANGDVNACCFDFNHDLVIGNMYENTFQDIIDGEKLKKIINIHRNNEFRNSRIICEKCDQIFCRDSALYFSKDASFKVGNKSQGGGEGNACVLCKSKDVVLWHDGTRDDKSAKVYKCKKCGLIFVSSYFTPDVICDELYVEGGMHTNNDDNMTIEERKNVYIEEDKRRADDIKSFIEGKSVLDFGCSYGGFLDAAVKYAKSVVGCEIEEDAVEYCTDQGYSIMRDIDENSDIYDVVVMSHVVEHLINPQSYLEKIVRHISQDGYLILEFPNADEALVNIYDSHAYKDFTYWTQHVCLYNEQTISILLDKIGFTVDEVKYIERYPLANHMYWLSRNKPGGHKIWDWMNDTVLNKKYEEILIEQKATDSILIVAKRK